MATNEDAKKRAAAAKKAAAKKAAAKKAAAKRAAVEKAAAEKAAANTPVSRDALNIRINNTWYTLEQLAAAGNVYGLSLQIDLSVLSEAQVAELKDFIISLGLVPVALGRGH